MIRYLALLLVSCGSSALPADHPCKLQGPAAEFIAECSARVAAICATGTEAECVAQEQACNDELAKRCEP